LGGLEEDKIGSEIYILDANVLIDFNDSDITILSLIATHIGACYVASPVLVDEVKKLDEAKCSSLGLLVVEPAIEQVALAEERRGKLSFYDHLSLVIAKASGWVVVTNEERLHRECSTDGVQSVWGLELLARLVDKEILLSEDALVVVYTLHELSPKFVNEGIIERFRDRIGYLE